MAETEVFYGFLKAEKNQATRICSDPQKLD